MDIKTPENKLENVTIKDSSFTNLLEYVSDSVKNSRFHLSLFLGVYTPHKKEALEKIKEATGKDVKIIDFNSIVFKSEEETFKNIDRLFDNVEGSDTLLYFKNGDKLCGAYTGFTHSRVKYASPQERYFINKVKAFRGLAIVDITEYTAADKSLRRAAHSIVTFPLPGSPLKRFLWHLKNYTFHGFELRSKRPEAYANTADNF